MKAQKYFIFARRKMIKSRKSLYSQEIIFKNMRRSKQEINDEEVLEEILRGAIICRLAFVDGDLPYIVPLNYGYRDKTIYIHSAPEGKKIDLLRKNPEVCFELEDGMEVTKGEKACDWSTRYRSVVGYGSVEILSDETSKQHGLEVIMAQHGAPDLREFDAGNMKGMVILKVRITSMSGKQSKGY
jgi:nitroimidazol reductase NimA-like FMN-containing flavoprotein (pyridoxamine 5'-phosphate oxidase superfamily)